MKNIKKAIAAAIVIAGFATNANAQSTDYATATATLVAPIKITKTQDMNFGQLASSGTAGTVLLDYANAVTATGGAKLLAATAVKTAEFKVEGYDAQTFSITNPTSIVLTGSVTGNLTVNAIAVDAGTTSALVLGEKIIKVKGTLVVPANQAAGVYLNNATDLANGLYVTVNYN